MKRRLAVFLAATLLSTIGMLVPAASVSATANPDVCAFTGTLFTSLGLGILPTNPANLVAFFLTANTGTCLTKTGFAATGTLHGWCHLWTGSGITHNGAAFHHLLIGAKLIIFGHLVGEGTVITAPGTGGLADKTATQFIVTVVVVLQGFLLPAGLPPTWQ